MADNQSDAGSIGRESNAEDEGAVPANITAEYVADLVQKTNTVSLMCKIFTDELFIPFVSRQ